MPLAYAFKHVFRSWRLFLALLIGITLASTFFAGIDIKASATAREALYQDLDRVYVDMVIQLSSPNSTQVVQAKESAATTSGVAKAEVLTRAGGQLKTNGSLLESEYARIVGIENTSSVYDGWLNRPPMMGANETYVWENSKIADIIHIGEACQAVFTIYPSNQTEPLSVTWDFEVKGFAQLNDKAYSIVSSYSFSPYYVDYRDFASENLFLVDWEATMLALSDAFRPFGPQNEPTSTALLIQVNRDAMIAPWDMETSVKNVKGLQYQIQNKLSTHAISSTATNNLESVLSFFTFKSMMIRMSFTFVSLPIFFMAWYLGTTVSDVSFNLRRREIGLLLTKGFSRGQIQRMFLTETLFLGIIGGALGVFFGFLLNPLFTELSLEMLFNPQLISPYTLAITMAFGAIIALLSTYSSAKRASQLPTIDALREYLNVEAVKPYRKRGPWIAFLLGTYKIVVYILGINMTTLVAGLMFSGANFFLVLLAIPVLFIDAILNYLGPLLFFWGACKIFIEGSLKFQELTTRVAKSLGDLGTLATKNVRRNPARSAATAFLIALIISYSAQVTGQLASEQDFNVRSTYQSVGADVSVYVTYPKEAKNVSSAILANVSDSIENATIEYSFDASSSSGLRTTVKAVQPQSWLKAAYYESGWFSGSSVETAFARLSEDRNTIVLERSLGSYLNLRIGDHIALNFGGVSRNLLIIGFFGPESAAQQSTFLMPSSSYYWSLVSEELCNELSTTVSAYSARILLKLKTDVNGTSAAENIRSLGLNVSGVDSFAEQWEKKQSDVLTVGILDAQRLGILFAVLAASVGTALVSFVNMKERSREATIMSVRGLSYKQLVTMFLTENLALVTFAVVLGVSVGFIVIYGNVSASNSLQTALIQRRIVFPLDATVTLVSCLTLIFVSTILPILIMSRRYVTKLERMVRLR